MVPEGPYLVVGLGRAGDAAARGLADRHGPDSVSIWDGLGWTSQRDRARPLLERGIRVAHGGDGIPMLDQSPAPAVLIKSPGLPFDTPLIHAAEQRGIPVLDEAELGWRLDRRPMVAVTGTNGKSTSVELVAAILRADGRSPVVAGNSTFGVPLTEAVDLTGNLIVAEISSFQLEGCPTLRADAGLFTNLGHDHLYRHGSARAYENCKRRLFFREDGPCPVAAIGIDQPAGQSLARDLRASGSRVTTFGLHPEADRRVLKVEASERGSRVVVSEGSGAHTLDVRLSGPYNALNLAGALALADSMGINPEHAASAIEGMAPLPGRFERLPGPHGSEVIVDYAHNPDGVAQMISAGRAELTAKGQGSLRVVMSALTLVGFDQTHAMGRIAATGADHLVLTTQRWNPEEAAGVLPPGLLEGALSAGAVTPEVETDRRAAIELALGAADEGDLILVLDRGNGGGNLFDDEGRPHRFDDRAEVRAAVDQLNSSN